MILNRFNKYEVAILQTLYKNGGEMKFEDMYQRLRETYPKFRRFQLAANAWSLQHHKHIIWDSPEGIKLVEEYIGFGQGD